MQTWNDRQQAIYEAMG